MAGQVLLLDLLSLFYRAYFALPAMTTTRGEPTSGVYGFAALLLKLLREEQPAGAAFAVDVPLPTFRHHAYAAYKAGRPAAPGALSLQMERLAQLTRATGLPLFGVEGYEADDVLATLARDIAAAGGRPLVVSGDRDTLQVARGPVEVLLVSRAGAAAERLDEAAVRRRYGVAPEQLPDFTALVGDPSDNLPGVPGVGARTAARLLAEHGGVRGLLAHLAEIEPPRIRRALAAHADRIPLWLHLARLRDDVPLPPGPRWAPVTDEARDRLRALFAELEFRSLLPRL